jgi:single-strand DNA-binding protein
MNIATFTGRLGRDADSRTTPSGKQVVNFSLAVDERRGGEKQTLWVSCGLWGERGQKLAQYLLKGSVVSVAGPVRVETYTNKAGEATAKLCCMVNDISLHGGQNQEPKPAQKPAQKPAPPSADPFDDDIPF